MSTVCGLAVAIVGLATAAHQAFSANLYTIPSDMFPRGAVGSVVGIGGTVGAIGGMMMAKFTGYVLETTHSYTLIFAVAGSVYLIAVAVVHLLSPRLARVDVRTGRLNAQQPRDQTRPTSESVC